jgi:hypothetical protein
MASPDSKCGLGVCTFITVVLCVILFFVGLNYVESQSYHQVDCYVSHLEYPTSLTSGPFVSCDCGHRCTSDRGTCIKIFGATLPNVTNSDIMIRRSNSQVGGSHEDTTCTFSEENCINGESVDDRLEAIAEARQEAEPYITFMNNSTPMSCFKKDGDDQLYFDVGGDSYDVLLGVGITAAVFLIGCVSCCIVYGRKNPNDKCFQSTCCQV